MKKFLLFTLITALVCSCSSEQLSSFSPSDYYYTGLIPVEYCKTNSLGNWPQPAGQYTYITCDGVEVLENVSPNCYSASLFSDGLAMVELKDTPTNKRGCARKVFINEQGEVVIKLEDYNASSYKGCSGFWNGYAIINSIEESGNNIKSAYLIINTSGEVVCSLPMHSSRGLELTPTSLVSEDGYISMFEERSYYTIFYNLQGEECLTLENTTSSLQFGQIGVYKTEGRDHKYGTVNIKGEIVIPFEFTSSIIFNVEGYAITTDVNNNVCVINTKGDMVIEPGKFKKLEYNGGGIYRGILNGQADNNYRWYNIKGEATTFRGAEIYDNNSRFDMYGNYLLNVPRPDNRYYALQQIVEGYSGLLLMVIDDEYGNIMETSEATYVAQNINSDMKVWDELETYYKYGTPYVIPNNNRGSVLVK